MLEGDPGSEEPAQAVHRLAEAMTVGGPPLSATLRSLAREYPSLFDDLEGRLILRALSTGLAPAGR
jgi:hypothetical protein